RAAVLVASGVGVVLIASTLGRKCLAPGGVLLVVARALEAVVALGVLAGADSLGVAEGVDDRVRVVARRLGVVAGGASGDASLGIELVGMNQRVGGLVEDEVIEQPLLRGQAIEQVEVVVTGLDAILPNQVLGLE